MRRQVTVVGAGIGGLTAALHFARHGFQTQVIERAEALQDIGAGIQVSPNAMRVFDHLGLSSDLEAVACEPTQAVIRHHRTGQPLLTTELHEACRQRYGAPYLQIHRADLLQLLAKAAAQQGVQLHLGQAAIGYRQTPGKAIIQCEDGTEHSTDLLVGADGIHSAIRTTMLGKEQPRFTGQVAWRATVPADKNFSRLLPVQAHLWVGPGRHFVAYWLRPGQLINLVAVQQRAEWTAENWHQPADRVDMQAAFAGWDPVIGTLIDACRECLFWGLFDRPPLERWTDGRVALLGDACHPMLPFMAQGGAMAVEDGHVLAAKCARLDDGEWADNTRLQQTLQSYEESRKPRASRLQQISRDNARLYNAISTVALLRRNWLFRLGRWLPQLVQRRLDRIYGLDVTAN